MKLFTEYIKEELDDNFFWLLDKWFEDNPQQLSDFISLVISYDDYKTNNEEFQQKIDNTQLLKIHLSSFVNFIDNDINPKEDKDYIQRLKDIIFNVVNNKSKKNQYIM